MNKAMSSDTAVQAAARRFTRMDSATARRLGRFGRAALTVARDPVEGVERIREKLADVSQRRHAPAAVEADTSWEASLHALLGAPWPCPEAKAFVSVWSETVQSLGHRGLQVGRAAYGGWDDADPGLARAAWCLTRHLEPLTVVETGVARGLTTRVVLEALEANAVGRLCSIDLPPPLERRRLEEEAGAAVSQHLKGRWTLIEGSSRRCLPGLLDELGTIDLFIHDSRHTHRNISFELALAWGALSPRGFLVADDVHCNSAFDESVRRFGDPRALVCASDDERGMFGLIEKPKPTDWVAPTDGTAATEASAR